MTLYNNNFKNACNDITVKDINNIEHVFNFTFPKEFKRHYLSMNGGRPYKNIYIKDNIYYEIQKFLPIKYGKKGFLFEDVFRILKIEKEILPEYFIPFATEPCGDFYCFSTKEGEKGYIYIFRGDEFDGNPESAIRFISKSLTEFINNMIEDD